MIIEKIHHQTGKLEKFSFSKYLSNELGVNYSQLSSVFSSCESITIEKFIIKQKIEKVKELLTYDELTLSEIAFKLGYSSVQHLIQSIQTNYRSKSYIFQKAERSPKKSS